MNRFLHIEGMNIVFSGKSAYFVGDDVEKFLKKYGAKCSHSVSNNTDFLVIGDKPGQNKLDKAEELSIDVVPEKKFYSEHGLNPEEK